MPCGIYWKQVHEVERAIKALRPHIELPGVFEANKELYKIRGALLAKIGLKFPRTISTILKLAGLSPGTITLFHDIESGWLVAARKTPADLPVYHYVDDATAVTILSGELTHELEDKLMTPDEYLGE